MRTIKLTEEQAALLMQYVSNKVEETTDKAVGVMRPTFLLESRKLENLFNALYEQVKQ